MNLPSKCRDLPPLRIFKENARGARGLLVCFDATLKRLALIYSVLVYRACWTINEVPYLHVENKGTLLAEWSLPQSDLSQNSRTEVSRGPEGFLTETLPL